MNIKGKVAAGALAAVVVMVQIAAFAETVPANAAAATPARGWMGARTPMPGLGMRSLLNQLDLSDAQRSSVRDILSAAYQQSSASRGGERAEWATLANPGDPGYAAAVAAAKERAVARVEKFNQVEQQIYALLTPVQRQNLTQLLAQPGVRSSKRQGARP